jgi:hypothetical protein
MDSAASDSRGAALPIIIVMTSRKPRRASSARHGHLVCGDVQVTQAGDVLAWGRGQQRAARARHHRALLATAIQLRGSFCAKPLPRDKNADFCPPAMCRRRAPDSEAAGTLKSSARPTSCSATPCVPHGAKLRTKLLWPGFSEVTVPRRRARARERERREKARESLRLGLWGNPAMASGETEYCLCPWGTAPLESAVRGRYIGLYWYYIL